AAAVDGGSRLLWRFPPRRLSAEEIRDAALQVSGAWGRDDVLDSQAPGRSLVPDGGPGFRLYHYMQDNVSTYRPLDHHGKETYRRAVYHQNARASVVDLMAEFDLPDCAFSTPRRSKTTTPLQALTMLNHDFTLQMAKSMAEQLSQRSDFAREQVEFAFSRCYARRPSDEELKVCTKFVSENGLDAFCRAILNTTELIHVQ
ncbi:MAG: DUF1553 domain-containing protein, partial [Planctomycetota bacterium]